MNDDLWSSGVLAMVVAMGATAAAAVLVDAGPADPHGAAMHPPMAGAPAAHRGAAAATHASSEPPAVAALPRVIVTGRRDLPGPPHPFSERDAQAPAGAGVKSSG